MWPLCTCSVYILIIVQVSNHYLENCKRSGVDTNSTIKPDGWTDTLADRHTDIHMMKGKTTCPPPLHGGGIKKYRMQEESLYNLWGQWRFRSACTLMQSNQGLHWPCTNSMTTTGYTSILNMCVDEHRRPGSDCLDVQADLGLYCLIMASGTFPCVYHIYL